MGLPLLILSIFVVGIPLDGIVQTKVIDRLTQSNDEALTLTGTLPDIAVDKRGQFLLMQLLPTNARSLRNSRQCRQS